MEFRKPLKTTYARRKRARVAAAATTSSPLQEIDHEDIPRIEMARRMRKRARSSDAERGSRPKDKASKRKRLGQLDNSHQAVSHAVPSNDLRPIDLNDPSQFQTPYTSLHSSAAEQATVPDILSPLPVARRILSRTNSRNLKENKSKSTSSRHTHSRSTSRGDLVLASPFHSRPGSLTSSPKKKSHSKHSKYGKSRANSDNRNHEPTFTMNHQNQSTQNSPHHSVTNKRICHNRVPSGPTDMLPANLLFEQDWLVPAKALNRAPLGEISRHDDEFFDGNGSFFGDVPLAYSTPLQKASDPRLHADNNDVIMQEPNALPLSRQRKIVHENADSIFSSLYYSAEISDPGTESTSHRYPKKQSLLSNPVALSFPSSPFPSESDFLQVANNDDPVPDPAILAHPPWNQISHDPFAAGFDPVIATPPPSPPRSRIIMVEGSPNGDALGEMFGVLDIQEHRTSHPFSYPATSDPTVNRSKSLDSPAIITTTTANRTKPQVPRRSRASTIRASDFAFPPPPVLSTARRTRSGTIVPAAGKETSSDLVPHARINARRTRSGTVVGPPSKPIPVPVPVLTGMVCMSEGRVNDDELMIIGDDILDDGWIICRGEGENLPELSSGSSNADGLTLKGL